ncbi:hypothetical protein SB49_06450 [Sediminicola sp. YIK13]|nr:hypothetical protein SB49_06450 [Sediminicola sp. YIK13]
MMEIDSKKVEKIKIRFKYNFLKKKYLESIIRNTALIPSPHNKKSVKQKDNKAFNPIFNPEIKVPNSN